MEFELITELGKYGLAGIFIAYLVFERQKAEKRHAKERKEADDRWIGALEKISDTNSKALDKIDATIDKNSHAMNSLENIILELKAKLT